MVIEVDGTIVHTGYYSVKEDFIVEYLGKVHMDYVQNIFRAWKNHCNVRELKAGTPGSFRGLIKSMKERGIIKVTRTEPTKYGINRNYYKLTEG